MKTAAPFTVALKRSLAVCRSEASTFVTASSVAVVIEDPLAAVPPLAAAPLNFTLPKSLSKSLISVRVPVRVVTALISILRGLELTRAAISEADSVVLVTVATAPVKPVNSELLSKVVYKAEALPVTVVISLEIFIF